MQLEALIKLGLFSLHLSPLGSGFFPTTCLFIHNCIKTPEPSGAWLQTCEVSAAFRALMQSHALQHPTGHEGGRGGEDFGETVARASRQQARKRASRGGKRGRGRGFVSFGIHGDLDCFTQQRSKFHL